jgi:hypothetical protein
MCRVKQYLTCCICTSIHPLPTHARRYERKCKLYGGRVNKTSRFFNEACRVSLEIDGTLIHVATEIKKLQEILSDEGAHYLTTLYYVAKQSAKDRAARGRTEAGIISITADHLIHLYQKQKGRCYYSGIQMNLRSHTDWRCSVERLDPYKGYIDGNVVLIIAELNSSVQWTTTKIVEFYHLNRKDHAAEYVERIEAVKLKRKRTPVTMQGELIVCNKCNVARHKEAFTQRRGAGCKKCRGDVSALRRQCPIGHFSKLLTTMRQSSKVRGHPPPTVTAENLLELFDARKGLCAISNIPMAFGNTKITPWICSVDRLNTKLGYTLDNIQLICYEFNTMDMSSMHEKTEGSSGWTAVKMQQFIEQLDDNIVSRE